MVTKVYSIISRIAVLVNGMGATPLMELYIANRHIHEVLTGKGMIINKNHGG